jgi:hypothetical protein
VLISKKTSFTTCLPPCHTHTQTHIYTHTTRGWWHIHLRGQASGNGWSGMCGMVSNISNMVYKCLMPFHLIRSGHYNESYSSPQPPGAHTGMQTHARTPTTTSDFLLPSLFLRVGLSVQKCSLYRGARVLFHHVD